MNKRLSPRLQAAADLLGERNNCADIGCDHGLLTAYLLQSGRVKTVFATDVSAPSLEKARSLCLRLGLSGARFACGDGFSVLPEKPEAALVCGMGGDLIARLIAHPLAQTALVLQPMKDSDSVYAALKAHGFCVKTVRLVREGRRFYEIIAAVPGQFNEDYLDLIVPDADARAFLEHKAGYLERARRGAEKGDPARAEELEREIRRIRGLKAYGMRP